MKKILISVLICVTLLSIVGCSSYEPPIKLEYSGKPLSSLTYETVDYMGGYTCTYFFDFDNNVVSCTTYMPYGEQSETKTREVCRFTDEAEKRFIDTIYSAGLFMIRDRYEPSGVVDDGGGWSLVINYADGTQKLSTGSNAGPNKVFDYCAIAAYDLTGEMAMGYVPTAYYTPPILDVGLGYEYTYKNIHYLGYPDPNKKRGNYSWNGHGEEGLDLYQTAVSDINSTLLAGEEYRLSISTVNYNNYNGRYEKFSRCVVKNYDLDPSLTGEKTLFDGKWFNSTKIPYEPNKIYLITLYFSDGDYVEYVFNTATIDQKIHYGQYNYNIYNVGKSVLTINEDGSFSLDPFDYFDENDRKPIEEKNSLVGEWTFEVIDGREYLVLTAQSGERLVLDYCARALFVEREKSTLDLERYHIEGDLDAINKEVDFSFNFH